VRLTFVIEACGAAELAYEGVVIRSFVFSEGKLAGQDLDLDALRLVRSDKGLIIWIDLENPTDQETRDVLEGLFQFHPLSIEDCVSVSQLPKIEDYEDYLFMVMHAVDFTRQDKFITNELNLFLGKDYLVTYHAQPLRSVKTAIERSVNKIGTIARGPDRLAHTLLDLMVDNYMPVLDELHGEIEELEDLLLEKNSGDWTPMILDCRKDLSLLRRIVRPQREVIGRLARGEYKLIRPNMLPYFRDIHDNLVRIEDTALSASEQLLTTFDLHINRTAQQSNEGIKILTGLTALTLPPVVVGSWFGMNFQNMPELGWEYSYPLAWLLTLGGTGAMWWWLKKKNLF
jgi:magnesium transporter